MDPETVTAPESVNQDADPFMGDDTGFPTDSQGQEITTENYETSDVADNDETEGYNSFEQNPEETDVFAQEDDTPTGTIDQATELAPASTLDDEEDDDAALREFTRKWEAECREKDAKNQALCDEMKQAAVDELAKFKEQYKIKVDARHESNKLAEEEFINQIKEGLTAENPWERVLSLVDLNANDPATSKDVSRLRQMLLQLKSKPQA